MTGKAAALGNADFVMPFTALGLESFAADERADILEKAQKILDEKYSFVVVAEDAAHIADEVFSQTEKDSLPCVVVVPFTKEPEGFAIASLAKALKMATGIDIVSSSN